MSNKLEDNFLEANMHSIFSKYLLAHSIFPKTINANESKTGSKGDNEWVHPDIVSVQLNSDKIELIEKIKYIMDPTISKVRLSSYELKLELRLSNLKRFYFQAVSNSSWANFGYLVVFKIEETEEFKKELARLVKAFGIGILIFNKDALRSKKTNEKDLFVVYDNHYAREKNELDFDFIEKLYTTNNSHFKSFLEAIPALVESKNEFTVNSVLDANFDKCQTFNQDLKLAESFVFSNSQQSNEEVFFVDGKFDWENNDWTNKKFEKVIYDNNEYLCETAIDVFIHFCSFTYSKNKEVFNEYKKSLTGVKNKKRVDFSLKEDELFKAKKILGTPYFTDENISNEGKKKKMIKLKKIVSLDEHDFQVYVKQ